jgi:hypothetical protein
MPRSNILKLVALFFVVIIIAIGAHQFLVNRSHRGLVKINVVVLPSDSKLQVDGTTKKAGGVYVKPGAHKLTAIRQYFDEVTKQIDTSSLKPGEIIYLLPGVSSAEAKQWLIDHPAVQQQREAVGSQEADQQQLLLSSKYPILDLLPQETSHYKIDYSLSSDNKLEFTINLFGDINGANGYTQYQQDLIQYKNEALKYLKDHGVIPQDYEITYIPAI